MIDLFPETVTKKPRKAARVMMKGVDHGFADERSGNEWIADCVCTKCGHKAGWLGFKTFSECMRGAPCPVCNAKEQA